MPPTWPLFFEWLGGGRAKETASMAEPLLAPRLCPVRDISKDLWQAGFT
jgi:hypothetical protein